MTDTAKMLKVIPLVQVRYRPPGGERQVHMPGTREKPAPSFLMDAAEAQRLAEMKPPAVEIVATTGAAALVASDPPVAAPTRAELEAGARHLGIDLSKVEGTGKNGALKNVDIENAIAARREELARAAGGNPSLVEE